MTALEQTVLLLSAVRMYLKHSCPPVTQLIEQLCEDKRLAPVTFPGECRKMLSEGVPFPQAWENAVKSTFPALSDENVSRLSGLGAVLGAVDLDGQLSACGLLSELLGQELKAKKESFEKSRRLVTPLCAFAGLGAVILLC